MKKLSLLLCFLMLSACNNGTNVPVASSESSAVIPLNPNEEPDSSDDPVVEDEKVFEHIVAGDQLPLLEEKCALSKYPLISLKRRYDRVKFLYQGSNEFEFRAKGYFAPYDNNNYQDAEYNLNMLFSKNIFTLINDYENVPEILYFDMILLGNWKLKSLTSEKMILTANVFGDQCDYTFGVPAEHYSDKDGDKVEDKFDCAPNDNTKFQSITVFEDLDGDGVGGKEVSLCIGSSFPEGNYTDQSDDCDDNDGSISPYLEEILGDGKDNNCDGHTDGEEEQDKQIFTDTDQDGYVDMVDCAPNDSNAYQLINFYQDLDLDGYGDDTQLRQMCVGEQTSMPDYSLISGDCDDQNSRIHPDYSGLETDRDLNCDGVIN